MAANLPTSSKLVLRREFAIQSKIPVHKWEGGEFFDLITIQNHNGTDSAEMAGGVCRNMVVHNAASPCYHHIGMLFGFQSGTAIWT